VARAERREASQETSTNANGRERVVEEIGAQIKFPAITGVK